MGCLLAADLAASGQEVVLVARLRTSANRLNQGICIKSGDVVKTQRVRVVAAEDMRAADGPPVVVSTVKSYDLPDSLHQVVKWLPSNGLVITLQNGLEAPTIATEVFGADRVLAGVTETAAARDAATPGEIESNGPGRTWIGRPGGKADAAVRHIRTVFRAAGWHVEDTDDVGGALWAKAAVNAAINPVGALLRKSNGWLAGNESARDLLIEVATEVGKVAHKSGHPLADPGGRVLEVARRTGANRCSMLQDIEAGRRTEIDAITGAILRRAEKVGIEVPINRTLFQLVSAVSRT